MRQLSLETLECRRMLAASIQAAEGLPYRDDSLLVRYLDPGLANLGAIVPGLSIQRNFSSVPGLQQLRLPGGVGIHDALNALRQDPNVLYAEPDYYFEVTATPNDPRYDELWGMNNIGQTGGTIDADADALEAWDVTTGSHRTIVAVIDTGVDYNHPDLAANMWTNDAEKNGIAGFDDDENGFIDDIYGYDFVNDDGDPWDDNRHGTHVAGTIGAVGNNGVGIVGVNWNVEIMAVKSFDANGSGSNSDAIDAINYAVNMGAHISNLSWGGNEPPSQAMYDAMQAAGLIDHIFVAGAGNGFLGLIPLNNDVNPFYPASYDLDNIIAVAATDHNDQIAAFSNYGATSVDLAAPGVDILSTFPGGGYELLSGTSMATPHVAGAVALLRDLHPEWSSEQIIAEIFRSVDLLDQLDGRMVTGGRLNVANALVPDTFGPQVVPGATRLYGAIDKLAISFTESIDTTTFTVDDIAEFTGPNETIVVSDVTPVPGSLGREFDIVFPLQTVPGDYTLSLGPDIQDLLGNALDQDDDGINGEPGEDRFTTSFELVDAIIRLDLGREETEVADGYAGLVQTDTYDTSVGYGWLSPVIGWNRTSGGPLLSDYHYAREGTFVVDVPNGQYDVVLWMGDADVTHDNMVITLEGVERDTVTSTVGEFLELTYLVTVSDGQLTIHLKDLGGANPNFAFNALEVINAGPDVTAPNVIDVSPSGTVSGSIERFEVSFDENIDETTFTIDDVSLSGPGGTFIPVSVAAVDVANRTRFELVFEPLQTAGDYVLSLGPDIRDDAGNPLGAVVSSSVSIVPYLEQFDFGTASTPVAEGYTQVLSGDTYNPSRGHGWLGYVTGWNRTSGGPLLSDYHYAREGTFVVDVPNGQYDVVLWMGDADVTHDNMVITLEGVERDTVTSTVGEFLELTYLVTVSDGQLTIHLKDLGGANPNFAFNALEVINAGPDVTAPNVIDVSPSGTVSGSIERFEVSFDENIDETTFTIDDVSLSGPGGTFIPVSVAAVDVANRTRFELVFEPLQTAGDYVLSLGPDIRDDAGNPLGAVVSSSVSIVPYLEQFDFGTASTPVAEGYTQVLSGDTYNPSRGHGWLGYVTGWNRTSGGPLLSDYHYAREGTFVVDVPNGQYDVVLWMGDADVTHDNMVITLEGVERDTVTSTVGEFLELTYLVTVSDGQLTIHLKDLGGANPNFAFNALEVINAGPDVTAPNVIDVSPSGTVSGSIERFEVSFDENIDETTFTIDDVSLSGPGGTFIPVSVAAVDVANRTRFELVFEPLQTAGDYVLSLGPDIRDDAGNPLGAVVSSSVSIVPYLEQFDFGTASTPVAEGYTQVLSGDTYNPSRGHGWLGYVTGWNRTSGGPLLSDYHYAREGTFVVDVPNGQYDVVLWMGDADVTHDNMVITLEGVERDTVTSTVGEFLELTYLVTVSDGQLTIHLKDLGGANPNFAFNALEVINAGPDVTAPNVIDVSPSGTVSGSIERFEVSFDENIDETTFTIDDVSLSGPGGTFIPVSVAAVDVANRTRFELVFEPLQTAGDYVLSLGPDIRDDAGNPLGAVVSSSVSIVPYLEQFDFGTASTPVAEGYTQVLSGDTYNPSRGHGWLGYVTGWNRTSGGPLLSDYHYAREGTFVVDVPNGQYDVVLWMGDTGVTHDNMVITLEGVERDTVTSTVGEFLELTYLVTVSDGQLTIHLKDLGGTNPNFALNGLELSAADGMTSVLGLASETSANQPTSQLGISFALLPSGMASQRPSNVDEILSSLTAANLIAKSSRLPGKVILPEQSRARRVDLAFSDYGDDDSGQDGVTSEISTLVEVLGHKLKRI